MSRAAGSSGQPARGNSAAGANAAESAAEAHPWTVQRLLAWSSDYFARGGSPTPRLDAEVLLSHALRCRRIDLYAGFDRQPSAEQLTSYRGFVKRHAGGEPVAYITGCKEFYSLPFEVNAHVLIPRPETELLVVLACDLATAARWPENERRVVDVGTGSGAIAVTLARQWPAARIVACDRSANALDVARRNATALGVAERIEFREGDLLSAVADRAPWQLVVSNPPYIGDAERASLPHSVVDFEPPEALFSGGPAGSEVIERLIDQAAEQLLPGGWLLLEVSPILAERVRARLQSDGRYDSVAVHRDLAQQPRAVAARRATGDAALRRRESHDSESRATEGLGGA